MVKKTLSVIILLNIFAVNQIHSADVDQPASSDASIDTFISRAPSNQKIKNAAIYVDGQVALALKATSGYSLNKIKDREKIVSAAGKIKNISFDNDSDLIEAFQDLFAILNSPSLKKLKTNKAQKYFQAALNKVSTILQDLNASLSSTPAETIMPVAAPIVVSPLISSSMIQMAIDKEQQ